MPRACLNTLPIVLYSLGQCVVVTHHCYITGILVLKILGPQTIILGEKVVPLDNNFRESWSASGI